jgi:hypothetical protein
MTTQELPTMNIHQLILNFAFSLPSSLPTQLRSDHLLSLLLLLTGQESKVCTTVKSMTPSQHIISEEFKHCLSACARECSSVDSKLHLSCSPDAELTTDIDEFLSAELGLSCGTYHSKSSPTGVLLGLFDSAMQLRKTHTLVDSASLEKITFNNQVLILRNLRKHSSLLSKTFQQWLIECTSEVPIISKMCRNTMQKCVAILDREAAHRVWLAKLASFRDMKVFKTKNEGVKCCEPGEWFCISRKDIYRMSMLLQNTAEKLTKTEAHKERWKIPDCMYFSGKLHDTDIVGCANGNSDIDRDSDSTFQCIECVRAAVRNAEMCITMTHPLKISAIAKSSMKTCTTKLSVLLHNLECCCGSAILLSSSKWLFDNNYSLHTGFYVLVVKDYCKNDLRAEWPSTAVLYECVLPKNGKEWAEEGVLLVVFSKKESIHVVNYHRRFSFGQERE